ncbi:MAG: serine protein kinase RIO [Methanophagales archaeon]|nr:serine protein kinase RIO [Methanophagales archaeon]
MAAKEGLLELEAEAEEAVEVEEGRWLRKEGKLQSKGKRRRKDFRDRKTELEVLDTLTLETLYKLSKQGILKALGGPVSSGKEAVVFHAVGGGGAEGELAVKIYKTSTSNFNAMLDYILGDPRFARVKRDRRSVVFAWARKEFKNLKRAFDAGVRVPKPIACEKNVLVMEFVGEGEGAGTEGAGEEGEAVAAPRLRDVPVEVLEREFCGGVEELFLRVVAAVKILYAKAGLVHADLSEFNILLNFNFFSKEKTLTKRGSEENSFTKRGSEENSFTKRGSEENSFTKRGTEEAAEPVIIDMGQSVLLEHPNADAFLRRDVKNIVAFFNKLGLDCAGSEDEILRKVKGERERRGEGKEEEKER